MRTAQLSADPFDISLKHDAWATRELLLACRGLSREEFHRRFEMGPGSLHDTITHMIGASRRWTDRLMGRALRPFLEAVVERTPDELLALHDAAAADLGDAAERSRTIGMGATITLDWPGEPGTVKRYTFSRAAVFVHVTTHGAHHRAQCLNMLRHLNHAGVSDALPDYQAVDWQWRCELPPEILPAPKE